MPRLPTLLCTMDRKVPLSLDHVSEAQGTRATTDKAGASSPRGLNQSQLPDGCSPNKKYPNTRQFTSSRAGAAPVNIAATTAWPGLLAHPQPVGISQHHLAAHNFDPDSCSMLHSMFKTDHPQGQSWKTHWSPTGGLSFIIAIVRRP